MIADLEFIINYWFSDIGPDRWFTPDPALDIALREKFSTLYESAARGDLKRGEETPSEALALMLLLDLWPRRMFRGTAQAYATDDTALDIARNSIIRHFDDRLDKAFKLLFYLPFAHAENMGDQRLAIFYIRERTKDPDWIDAAEAGLDIIQRFDRFPARNAALGRTSTPEEIGFLGKPNGNTVLFD